MSDTGSGHDATTSWPASSSRSSRPRRPAAARASGSPWCATSCASPAATSALASSPGVGTTVELLLPELVGARPTPRATRDPGAGPRGTESILVVDDEPAVAAFARRSLADLGYAVCVEHSVRAAIDHIHRCGAIDLLLSDVVLPDGIGAEVADAVREARPGTPTLFVCGYTADALADRGVSVAGLDVLAKPYDGIELAIRVRRALDAADDGPDRGAPTAA